ncbi:hypothetical protein F5Y19DRAFT_23486 [Xylariaceae sp. FL1651]|nr:hypothetical protein F5Y19DRAFT_23486 [Xylariaceae sp. FL1651]
MIQPIAILKAIKSRDWAVASASLCSLTLRVTIILSTALFALTPTEVHDAPAPITIRSGFVNSTADLDAIATQVGTLSDYSMRGLSERTLSFPDGTSYNYALQQFNTTGLPHARLNVTVEGFTIHLSCQAASLNISYKCCDPLDTGEFCWALETQQCQFPIRSLGPDPMAGDDIVSLITG